VDPETTRFLVTLIRDNNQTPNIRNLAANALTVPGRWVAGLADVFLRQAQDPSEDPMWRDYALQHAGTLAIHGQDVDRVVPVLETVALSTSPSAGTAFLMLHRIVTAQHTIFNTTVLRTLVTSVAHDPVRDINTTVVVLGVLGEMRNAAYSADLRPLLACPAPTVRRAAAGLFGLVGSAHDIDGLRQLTNDADVSVAAAADIAIRRLANQKSN
jgi:HEAT repeat protein